MRNKRYLRLLALFLVIGLSIGSVYAQKDEVTLRGVIIDSACAGAHSSDMSNFIQSHTKDCALMPACEKSGYNIYSEGVLYKFDAAGSAKVAKFLKENSSSLKVTVRAEKRGDIFRLISIENAQS